MMHRHGLSLGPPRGASRVDVVVGVFLALNVVALLGCGGQAIRDNGWRTWSTNNLKQLGLAVHGYHDVMRKLPYNGTQASAVIDGVEQGGNAHAKVRGSGSWVYQVLPYVEQQALFNEQSGSGNGPESPLAVLQCPGRARTGFANVGFKGAQTDYQINPYLNRPDLLVGNTGDALACNRPDTAQTLFGVKDGTSNVLLAGHAYFKTTDYTNQNGNDPLFASIYRGGQECSCRTSTGATAADYRMDNATSPTSGWGGPYNKGGLFAMADATVRLFPYGTNLAPFFDSDDGVQASLPD